MQIAGAQHPTAFCLAFVLSSWHGRPGTCKETGSTGGHTELNGAQVTSNVRGLRLGAPERRGRAVSVRYMEILPATVQYNIAAAGTVEGVFIHVLVLLVVELIASF